MPTITGKRLEHALQGSTDIVATSWGARKAQHQAKQWRKSLPSKPCSSLPRAQQAYLNLTLPSEPPICTATPISSSPALIPYPESPDHLPSPSALCSPTAPRSPQRPAHPGPTRPAGTPGLVPPPAGSHPMATRVSTHWLRSSPIGRRGAGTRVSRPARLRGRGRPVRRAGRCVATFP